MEKQVLANLIGKGLSARKIAENQKVSYSTVRYYLKKYELKTAFDRYEEWDVETVRELAKTANSKREILIQLGYRDTGSVYETLNRVANLNNIVLPKNKLGRRAVPSSTIQSIFKDGTSVKGAILRKHMLNHYGVAYKCLECSISEWNGKEITLEVDHIDGNHTNNVIQNLRFLCPNCHSQTPTHSRKKKTE